VNGRAFYHFHAEGKDAMTYKIAAIDIHKKVLMVVVATMAAEVEDATGQQLEFECRRFGAGHNERNHLVSWLRERKVTEIVMESTAQYWRPVWLDLEPHFAKLHLAHAFSNRAPKGRKSDFQDAKRLARRLAAGELSLSFVPPPEQRMWRTLTRKKHQLIRDRIRLQNQIEALLEETRIKLSSVITDLLGASGRLILKALSEGQTDPVKLAQLGNKRLQCTKEELADALNGSPQPLHLEVLKLSMTHVELLDQQIASVDRLVAQLLGKHEQAVKRVAEVPGFGVDSAQQAIAEIGVDAADFPSASAFCSWVGLCPGSNESAEQNKSSRSPKGNRFLRRILTQAAHAAVKKKDSHFQNLFRRLCPRLGYKGAIWAVAHRLGRVLWKLLHDNVDYIEQGDPGNPETIKKRAQKLLRSLRNLGYSATLIPLAQERSTSPVA
jgi:transposase